MKQVMLLAVLAVIVTGCFEEDVMSDVDTVVVSTRKTGPTVFDTETTLRFADGTTTNVVGNLGNPGDSFILTVKIK